MTLGVWSAAALTAALAHRWPDADVGVGVIALMPDAACGDLGLVPVDRRSDFHAASDSGLQRQRHFPVQFAPEHGFVDSSLQSRDDDRRERIAEHVHRHEG